jgi:hypothetical protein
MLRQVIAYQAELTNWCTCVSRFWLVPVGEVIELPPPSSGDFSSMLRAALSKNPSYPNIFALWHKVYKAVEEEIIDLYKEKKNLSAAAAVISKLQNGKLAPFIVQSVDAKGEHSCPHIVVWYPLLKH